MSLENPSTSIEKLRKLSVWRSLTVGVEERRFKLHLGRHVRVLHREGEAGAEETTCEYSVSKLFEMSYNRISAAGSSSRFRGVSGAYIPTKSHTSIQLHVVRDHEHHLPFENIAIDQTTADSGNILIGLHLLQLARQHTTGGGRRHGVGR